MKFAYRRQATDEETIEVEVVPIAEREGYYRITVGEQVFELPARLLQRAAMVKASGEIVIQYQGREYRLYDAAGQRRRASASSGDLCAPMAGKVIDVLVQPGDQVAAGDVLLILEAMKMEQRITAPHPGVIRELFCAQGEHVAAGTELVVLEPLSETP